MLEELKKRVKNKEITWSQANKLFFEATGEVISDEAFRSRCRKLENAKTGESYNHDGSVDILKKITFYEKEEKTPNNILKKLGYNPEEWSIINYTFGSWETFVKNEGLQMQTTVKIKMKPITHDLSSEKALEIAKKLFASEIIPLEVIPRLKPLILDNNLLLELPALELHLGKMAWNGDVGEDYDSKIAAERFYDILEDIVTNQEMQKCGNCVLYIGNDFFNSDTVDNTTTKGTLQHNDSRWKKSFLTGLKLYTEMLLTLREKFNKIDIKLCQGNHDTMASFYLFIALSQYFKNDNVLKFSDDYKETQSFIFGNNVIFTNHGDPNLKRLIKSIPAEFYKEWGMTIYRHLHLGHLHKEFVVDDDSGLVVWRVGSPTGTEHWHYHERFIGATQKYQTFTWHKEHGLITVNYTNFSKKKPVRIRK